MKNIQNIFLIGFMGAGKSSIAKELSKRLQMNIVEMDQRIVQEQGMSINEIFEKYGEDHFRDIESQLILDLGNTEPVIVSCGGGVVIRQENSQYMKKSGKVVFLTAKPETIFERVRYSKERPILNGNMNVEFIADLMAKRLPLYEAAADVMIHTDGKTVAQIAEEIIEAVES